MFQNWIGSYADKYGSVNLKEQMVHDSQNILNNSSILNKIQSTYIFTSIKRRLFFDIIPELTWLFYISIFVLLDSKLPLIHIPKSYT